MTEFRLILAICIITSLGYMSCGNQISLTGGPKDEMPPQLIVEESSPNYETNFVKTI